MPKCNYSVLSPEDKFDIKKYRKKYPICEACEISRKAYEEENKKSYYKPRTPASKRTRPCQERDLEKIKERNRRSTRAYRQAHPEIVKARRFIYAVKRRIKNKIKTSRKEIQEILQSLPSFCIKCLSFDNLSVDHILPLTKHPELAFCKDNLTTLCRSCNASKGNR